MEARRLLGKGRLARLELAWDLLQFELLPDDSGDDEPLPPPPDHRFFAGWHWGGASSAEAGGAAAVAGAEHERQRGVANVHRGEEDVSHGFDPDAPSTSAAAWPSRAWRSEPLAPVAPQDEGARASSARLANPGPSAASLLNPAVNASVNLADRQTAEAGSSLASQAPLGAVESAHAAWGERRCSVCRSTSCRPHARYSSYCEECYRLVRLGAKMKLQVEQIRTAYAAGTVYELLNLQPPLERAGAAAGSQLHHVHSAPARVLGRAAPAVQEEGPPLQGGLAALRVSPWQQHELRRAPSAPEGARGAAATVSPWQADEHWGGTVGRAAGEPSGDKSAPMRANGWGVASVHAAAAARTQALAAAIHGGPVEPPCGMSSLGEAGSKRSYEEAIEGGSAAQHRTHNSRFNRDHGEVAPAPYTSRACVERTQHAEPHGRQNAWVPAVPAAGAGAEQECAVCCEALPLEHFTLSKTTQRPREVCRVCAPYVQRALRKQDTVAAIREALQNGVLLEEISPSGDVPNHRSAAACESCGDVVPCTRVRNVATRTMRKYCVHCRYSAGTACWPPLGAHDDRPPQPAAAPVCESPRPPRPPSGSRMTSAVLSHQAGPAWPTARHVGMRMTDVVSGMEVSGEHARDAALEVPSVPAGTLTWSPWAQSLISSGQVARAPLASAAALISSGRAARAPLGSAAEPLAPGDARPLSGRDGLAVVQREAHGAPGTSAAGLSESLQPHAAAADIALPPLHADRADLAGRMPAPMASQHPVRNGQLDPRASKAVKARVRKCGFCAATLPMSQFRVVGQTKLSPYCPKCTSTVNRGLRKGFTVEQMLQMSNFVPWVGSRAPSGEENCHQVAAVGQGTAGMSSREGDAEEVVDDESDCAADELWVE